MTDLYLCVPHDYSYFMYCDLAYKYNERTPEERDSGFDVYCANDVHIAVGHTAFLNFGIESCYARKDTEPRAFWLVTHSSISKTNFICDNQLIDSGYREPLMGAVRKLFGEPEMIKSGDRLFQIVSGNAQPWRTIIVVREFPQV